MTTWTFLLFTRTLSDDSRYCKEKASGRKEKELHAPNKGFISHRKVPLTLKTSFSKEQRNLKVTFGEIRLKRCHGSREAREGPCALLQLPRRCFNRIHLYVFTPLLLDPACWTMTEPYWSPDCCWKFTTAKNSATHWEKTPFDAVWYSCHLMA